jgi:hypothetical protein
VSLEPCPYCKRADFPSKDARRMHVLRCRRKDESMPANDKLDRIFESFGKPKYENMFQSVISKEEEKPKSTPRETPKKFTGSDILQIYEAQATIVKTDLETGRIADFSDAVEELETRLLANGISKERVKDFVRVFKHRLSAERLSNPSQPKQLAPQPQPQPQPKEPTLDERAEMEAQKVNAQRGFSQGFICTICGNWYATYEEADRCDKSHSVQSETLSQQEQEIEKPQPQSRLQPQALPQSDILFRLGKSLVNRLKSPKTEKKEEEQETAQVQEESYSPITYMNTVRWTPPEPIESQECKICGRIDYISNFRAGLHGRGVCS